VVAKLINQIILLFMFYWMTFVYTMYTGIAGPNTITVTRLYNDAQVYVTPASITYIFE
jgi:hypothetical protein